MLFAMPDWRCTKFVTGLGSGVLLGAVFVLSAVLPARADQQGNEGVLLVVRDEAGRETRFNRMALEALPQIRFRTSTIWTDGTIGFSGPALRNVLPSQDSCGGRVRLMALNEYSVMLDRGDLQDEHPIIATRRDEMPYTVRENGPLWLVYPFDRGGFFSTERAHYNSIWQLTGIECLP